MSSPQPLAGITVLEIGQSVAGPYAGMILAELGARVIKLEPPGRGDDARHWGPPFADGAATAFRAVNRGKFGIAADLTHAKTRARVLTLIADQVDVVLHNLKTGAMERLGLGAPELIALKPSLVYCTLGAYGPRGPLADRPGYDPLMQAFSGLMSTLGEEGRPPVRVSVSAIDMTAGMWAAIGILAALRERERTGRGGVVDTSLCESALALMAAPIAGFQASGRLPSRIGSGHPTIVPTQAFSTADGYLMVAVGSDAQFARFAATLGAPELATDPRFRTNPARVSHRAELVARIEAALAGDSARNWSRRLDDANVPNGLLHSVAEAIDHPQTRALGIVQEAPGDGLPLVGLPLSFDGVRPPYRRGAPALGEHDAVLDDGRS